MDLQEQAEQKWSITGGSPLVGEIKAAGAKNAVTKQLVATLLTVEPCVFTNVPRIREIDVTLPMLEDLGTKFRWISDSELEMETPISAGMCPPNTRASTAFRSC